MNPQYIQQQHQPGQQYGNSFGAPSYDGPTQNMKIPQQYPAQKMMQNVALPPQKPGVSQQMPIPPQQISGMSQQMPLPPQQIPGPPPPQQQQQQSRQPQQISGVSQQIPAPQQQISGPPQQMPGVSQQIPAPQQQISGPPQQMPGLPQQIPSMSQQMPGPPQKIPSMSQQIPGSPQQVPGLSQQTSRPPQQTLGPPPPPSQASGLSQQVSRPTPPIQTQPSSNVLSQNTPIIQQRPPMVGGPMPPQLSGQIPQQQGQAQNYQQPGYPTNYNQQLPQQQLGANYPETNNMSFQQTGQMPQQQGRIQNYQQQQPGYPMNYRPPQQPQDLYNIQGNQYHQPDMNMHGTASPVYQPNQQGQQAKRLDPDAMPSPIQVMQDDQKNRGGEFITNQKGLVPPFVTTKFIVQDQGNASPRFIRSTIYTVPTTNDIIKQSGIPFGLIISPMAKIVDGEDEPPIVDMGDIGPIRCTRCQAYMCPYMQFIDAGRRFQCSFCHATTEVPNEYFQHLDHTGQRMDRYERPELMLGTYEFMATQKYCRDNIIPKPPAVIFIIDVSYNNIKSGLINLICNEMKNILKNLPIDIKNNKTNMKVGFITYSNTVHFYNINSNLTQPQMMVVGDIHEIFMPLLDGFLCDANESETVIDSLMTQIPLMFSDTRETETILAPAIQAGMEALKSSGCTGKLIVLHSSLPIYEAPGKLKNRDDRKLLGTDKEKTILTPQNDIYNTLGQDCVNIGCSVDLFLFNNSYIDIATIGQVCHLSGGEVFKYTYFQADTDGDRLITDINNKISRLYAFDAVMRVRTSTGVRPTDFYGHFYMSNTTDMEIASIDCNKAIGVEIKHDDKLNDDDSVYIQVALLYTSCSGIRRLRIINLSLKTSSQMPELYRACDQDAVINFLSKQSVFELYKNTPKLIKDNLIKKCATILGAYRKHCAVPFSSGRLVLPEAMKLLPLYVNCMLKSDAISGGSDMTVDDRSYIMMAVITMPIYTSIIYFYPRLLALHDININDNELPQQLRCSIDKFTDDGAFLLENGIHMFLWLGSGLSVQWIQAVFGSPIADTERTSLPVLDNRLNQRIRDIITQIRAEKYHCMRLTIVRQRDKLETVIRHFLVEDKGNNGSPNYVDFLCLMHLEIKKLLNQ